MANEARVHAEGAGYNDIVRWFTVAASTAYPQGSLMVGSGADRTARLHTTGTQFRPLGFAVEGRTTSDPETRIGVQRTGVVDAFIDGVVTTGDLVCISETTANRLRRANVGTAALSYQEVDAIVGRALENGTDGQQIRIALTLG